MTAGYSNDFEERDYRRSNGILFGSDSVYKGGVLTTMEGIEPRLEAAHMVAKENEVQVHKLQWLSKADVNKVHGSMVL